MTEITLTVTVCDESGFMAASWNEPDEMGGITTQAKDLRELEKNVRQAVENGGAKLDHRAANRSCFWAE